MERLKGWDGERKAKEVCGDGGGVRGRSGETEVVEELNGVMG